MEGEFQLRNFEPFESELVKESTMLSRGLLEVSQAASCPALAPADYAAVPSWLQIEHTLLSCLPGCTAGRTLIYQ